MPLCKFSCLLYNSETHLDVFEKLGKNRLIRQCAKIKNFSLSCIFHEIMPLCNFKFQWCLLCNLKTVKGIFMKLSTNIKYRQMIHRKEEVLFSLQFSWNYAPFSYFTCPPTNSEIL